MRKYTSDILISIMDKLNYDIMKEFSCDSVEEAGIINPMLRVKIEKLLNRDKLIVLSLLSTTLQDAKGI